jgi:periplasmic divalent cation tolerance protein
MAMQGGRNGRFEMKRGTEARVVLVTCGSLAEGRKIARSIVTKHLAACVNLVSAPVESIYRWKGKIESAKEFLLVIKTTARRLKELEKEIVRLHSYEVPEFLAVRVDTGSRKYLQWVRQNVSVCFARAEAGRSRYK